MAKYDVCDFGAMGDGITNDAVAIQKTIDQCYTAGGGKVLIPAGKVFMSGRIIMKSNVELYVERGAILIASPNSEDFYVEESVKPRNSFITANGAENISFSGGGIIHGAGKDYIEEDLKYIYKMRKGRPFTFFLIGCKNVTFRDITVRDGALWTIRLTGCVDVVIHGIRVLNDLKVPNSDAIDLDHCQNVRISDCHIEAGDDCIVMKTYKGFEEYGPCENITVTGCTMICTSFAINIGCEARNIMRDMVFDSCVIRSSHRGIGVHLSEESNVENIIFSNMIIETRLFHDSWWGKAEPIYVVVAPWTSEHKIGKAKHIRFSNILCRGENGVFIQGWEKDLLEDVVLENVRVEINKTTKWPGGFHDLRPCPLEEQIYEYPTSGFFIKNAKNITIRNCEVTWGDNCPDYFHHALESHNVDNLVMDNFIGEAAHPDKFASIISD